MFVNLTEYLVLCICHYITDDKDIIYIGDNMPFLLLNNTFKEEYIVCKENDHVYQMIIDENMSVEDMRKDPIFKNFSFYIMCSASYNSSYYYDPIYKKRPSLVIV